jgi:hypothetical protein
MIDAAIMTDSHEIVVDEVFPHTPEVVWKTLTHGRADGPLVDDADRLRAHEG